MRSGTHPEKQQIPPSADNRLAESFRVPAGHPEPSHPAIESGGQISGLGERSSRRAEEPGGGGEVADGAVFDPCVDNRTALLACFGPPEAHCAFIIWEGGVPMTPPQQFR